MKELECPHCGFVQDAHEERRDQDCEYEHQCGKCGEWFGYTANWEPDFLCYEQEEGEAKK